MKQVKSESSGKLGSNKSSMKSVIYKFDPVIYPFKLLVSKNFDGKELGEKFYCVNDIGELDDAPAEFIVSQRTVARTIQCAGKKDRDTYMMILLCRPKVIGNGTIAHESMHVANIVAEWLGFFPKDSMQDEPCAYIAQWVANCIGCVIENKINYMNGERVKSI